MEHGQILDFTKLRLMLEIFMLDFCYALEPCPPKNYPVYF